MEKKENETPKKMCPKIILEGTRLTHKTEIAFALNEHPKIVGPRKYRYHSPIISAEWCAFTNFPWGRGLINFEPNEEHLAMETYQTWLKLFELQKYYSWIIDRFHISTQLYQKIKYNKDYEFRWMEDKLLELGFHLVFCYRTPKSFEKARKERIKISGKPEQYDDLEKFIIEQNLLCGLIERSILPKLELDLTDDNIPNAVDKIAEWMAETGGLYIK
jgi:hypothetical protein